MISSKILKAVVSEARPILERMLDDAELIAGMRDVIADNGGDWGSLKALIKAQIQDERDEAGDGKRVKKILDKADYSAAYADMLGLVNMNENNFSDDALPTAEDVRGLFIETPHDPETGEVINEIPAGSPVSSPVRPDKKVDDASSVPAPDSHNAGPVETTVKPKTASTPDAVASASGPISDNPSEDGEAYADEAATMERHVSASPPQREMEIPAFLDRRPKRQVELA